jgi:hypothetical protein
MSVVTEDDASGSSTREGGILEEHEWVHRVAVLPQAWGT